MLTLFHGEIILLDASLPPAPLGKGGEGGGAQNKKRRGVLAFSQ